MTTRADTRRTLAALAAERDREGRAGRILGRCLAALVVLALVVLPVLWLLGVFSTPPAVIEVRRLVDTQVEAYDRVSRGESPFDPAPVPRSVFEQVRAVPRAYREQVDRDLGRLWEARERAEMDSYFALTADQRRAELDRRIRADEERRRQWQAEREKRERERAASGGQIAAGGGQAGSGGGGGGGGAAGGGGGGAPGGGRPNAAPWGGGTQEARNQRMKERLDRTSPEQRARQAEYRRALDARRAQLGLSAGGGRRGG